MHDASKIKFYIQINPYNFWVLFSLKQIFSYPDNKYSFEILYISKLKFIN